MGDGGERERSSKKRPQRSQDTTRPPERPMARSSRNRRGVGKETKTKGRENMESGRSESWMKQKRSAEAEKDTRELGTEKAR